MLNASGIATIARTAEPARVGRQVFTIDHIVRATTSKDWVDGAWVELTDAAAERLSVELVGERQRPLLALTAAPEPLPGEIRELSSVG